MRWVSHIAHVAEINEYKVLVGKLEGKRPLRRSRHRWEDNIGIDLMEIGWEGVDWLHLTIIEMCGRFL
jgi:hypothetical protein